MTPETILSALRAEHEASVRLHQHHLDSLAHEDGIRRVLHLHGGTWGIVRDGASLVVRDEDGEVAALVCPVCGSNRFSVWEGGSISYDVVEVGGGLIILSQDDTADEGHGDHRVYCNGWHKGVACRAEYTLPDADLDYA